MGFTVKKGSEKGSENQDKFEHDKGQIHLQFRGAVSTGGSPLEFLLFLQYVRFSKTSPVKSGEGSEKPQWRKSRQILSHLWLSWFFRP